jgi:hypothetical protein
MPWMPCPFCGRKIEFTPEERDLLIECAQCEGRFTPAGGPSPATPSTYAAPQPPENRQTRVPYQMHSEEPQSRQLRGTALVATLAIVGSVVGVLALIFSLNAPKDEQEPKGAAQHASRLEPSPAQPVRQHVVTPADVQPPDHDASPPKKVPVEDQEPRPPRPKLPIPVPRLEPAPSDQPLPKLPDLGPGNGSPVPVAGKLLREIVPGYETREINGFTMLLSTLAVKEGKNDDGRPFKALVTEFDGLVNVLPPKTLKLLRRVLVWIEWDNVDRANPNTLAKYYGGTIWTLNGSEHPLKTNAIEVLSLKNLTTEKNLSVERSRLVLLHELGHAVHHLALPRGFQNPGVIFAYNQAMDRRLYDRVQTARGGVARAYAARNSAEYFAELTCAYLDRCSYFPFDREELKEHDPTGYRLMEGVWGKPGQKVAEAKEHDNAAEDASIEEDHNVISLYMPANVPAGRKMKILKWWPPVSAYSDDSVGRLYQVTVSFRVLAPTSGGDNRLETKQTNVYFFVVDHRVLKSEINPGDYKSVTICRPM